MSVARPPDPRPRGRGRAGRRATRRRARSTLISHGLPQPHIAVARARKPRSVMPVPCRPPSPSGMVGSWWACPTMTSGPRDRATGRRPQGCPPEPRGRAGTGRLGGHDRVGHDDRRRRCRHRRLRDRRDRRRPPWRPRRARASGWRPSFDISSDLEEFARTPMLVVCAGPKAILDLPLTLEYLETRGVPVVALGQADMPGFFSPAGSRHRSASPTRPRCATRPDPSRPGPRLERARLRPGSGCRGTVARGGSGRRRAGHDRGRGGRPARPGRDALAPGPDRRADRWGEPAGEHRAHRERRTGRRTPGRRPRRGSAS